MGQIEILEGSEKIIMDDPLKRTKDKVCIIGFADSHKQAPYESDEYEFWGVNEMHLVPTIKKLDVLFELHDYKWIAEDKKIKGHIAWLRENKSVPVFMQKHFPDIPLSVPFPREQIVERFGNYFTNTISWEIALAIMLGFKEIRLYGVNMANEIEYSSQRPSCEYFLGIAKGMGIEVYIPPESDLLKTMYQYGFEDGELSMMAAKMKAFIAEQDGGFQFAQNQINQGVAQMNQRIGAKHAAEYLMKAFVYPNTNFVAEKRAG
jgi:hypothetical protein